MFVCHMLSCCSAAISLLSIAARVRVCLLVYSSACFGQKVTRARGRAAVSWCLLESVCDFFGLLVTDSIRLLISVSVRLLVSARGLLGSVCVCLCLFVSVCVCLCLFGSVSGLFGPCLLGSVDFCWEYEEPSTAACPRALLHECVKACAARTQLHAACHM